MGIQRERDAVQGEMDRIQRTLKLVNDQAPVGVAAPVETTFATSPQPTGAVETQVLTPEIRAGKEIENNSKQIDEIQKLLDSIK